MDSLKQDQNRIVYIDFLRALMTFQVILLHISAPFLYRYGANNTHWWTSHIYNSLTRNSVPVFIMMSGLLLLSRSQEETVFVFLKKRLLRVLLPFVCWYIIYYLNYGKHSLSWPGFDLLLLGKNIMEGPTSYTYHFWFVYLIVALYLVTPVLQTYIRNASKGQLLYFILLGTVFTFCSTFFPRYLNLKVGLTTYSMFISGYLVYFVAGYYIHHIEIRRKKMVYLAALAGFLITVFGTYYESNRSKSFELFLYDRNAVNVFLMAVGIFLFFRDASWKRLAVPGSLFYKGIRKVSLLSYGIYLCHVLVINVWSSGILGFRINATSFIGYSVPIWIGTLLFSILTFVSSFLLIYILNLIPFVRRMVN